MPIKSSGGARGGWWGWSKWPMKSWGCSACRREGKSVWWSCGLPHLWVGVQGEDLDSSWECPLKGQQSNSIKRNSSFICQIKTKKQINKKTQNKKERLAILHAWKFSKLKWTDTEQCDIALKLDLLWAGGWTSRESFPPKLFQDSTALGLYMQDQLLWGQIDSIWLSVHAN